MNFSQHMLPALAGAVVGAALTATIGTGPHTPHATHDRDQIHHHTSSASDDRLRIDAAVETHDGSLTAMRDMHAHAIEHLGVFEDEPDSYGMTVGWSPLWHLRWIDVHHDGRTVRIYHATDAQHPDRRFTAIRDGSSEPRWEPAD
jgi:hypothetical protein